MVQEIADDGGQLLNAREESSFGAPNFDIEDYSFVNIGNNCSTKSVDFTIFGRIDNLTNEQYLFFRIPVLGRGAYLLFFDKFRTARLPIRAERGSSALGARVRKLLCEVLPSAPLRSG